MPTVSLRAAMCIQEGRAGALNSAMIAVPIHSAGSAFNIVRLPNL